MTISGLRWIFQGWARQLLYYDHLWNRVDLSGLGATINVAISENNEVDFPGAGATTTITIREIRLIFQAQVRQVMCNVTSAW